MQTYNIIIIIIFKSCHCNRNQPVAFIIINTKDCRIAICNSLQRAVNNMLRNNLMRKPGGEMPGIVANLREHRILIINYFS